MAVSGLFVSWCTCAVMYVPRSTTGTTRLLLRPACRRRAPPPQSHISSLWLEMIEINGNIGILSVREKPGHGSFVLLCSFRKFARLVKNLVPTGWLIPTVVLRNRRVENQVFLKVPSYRTEFKIKSSEKRGA
jgi:hypothetical protein